MQVKPRSPMPYFTVISQMNDKKWLVCPGLCLQHMNGNKMVFFRDMAYDKSKGMT